VGGEVFDIERGQIDVLGGVFEVDADSLPFVLKSRMTPGLTSRETVLSPSRPERSM
jgi:hypothetical protein